MAGDSFDESLDFVSDRTMDPSASLTLFPEEVTAAIMMTNMINITANIEITSFFLYPKRLIIVGL